MPTIAPGNARNLPRAINPSAIVQGDATCNARPPQTITGSQDTKARLLRVMRGRNRIQDKYKTERKAHSVYVRPHFH